MDMLVLLLPAPPPPIDTGIKTWASLVSVRCRPKPRRIKLGRVPCSPSRRKPGPAVTCRAEASTGRRLEGPRRAGMGRVIT